MNSVQFAIHSFEALINNRSLRLAIFRKLLNIRAGTSRQSEGPSDHRQWLYAKAA
jgi:hypothetical protein